LIRAPDWLADRLGAYYLYFEVQTAGRVYLPRSQQVVCVGEPNIAAFVVGACSYGRAFRTGSLLDQRRWAYPPARWAEEDRMKIEGGCLCGKVRYSADAKPAFVGICHCTDCQKESGTAFNVVVAIPQPALSIHGELNTFSARGDSGKEVQRRFCPECGSTITSEPEALPGVSIVRVGTLDDTSWIKPAMEIYCDSAQSWVQLTGDRQRFPKMPPRP
jgi:hypothetical protein